MGLCVVSRRQSAHRAWLDDLRLLTGSILVVNLAYVDFTTLYAWVGKSCI